MGYARRPLPLLFIEINAQCDFFDPGPMQVQRADSVVRNMEQLRWRFRRARMPIIAGMDLHQARDFEFSSGRVPPHAIAGTQGQRACAGAADRSAKIIPLSGKRRPWPNIREIVKLGGKLVFEKNQFDLFSNPACREVLKGLDPKIVYLFGATLEEDIHATALSARTVGYDVCVVTDATGIRDENAAGVSRAGMQKRGVKFESTDVAGTEIVLWQKRMERERRQKAAH